MESDHSAIQSETACLLGILLTIDYLSDHQTAVAIPL